MTEREAFEAWARGEGRGRLDRGITYLDRDDSGRYYHTHVLAAEQAWQASAARYAGVVEAARTMRLLYAECHCGGCQHCDLSQALAALDGAE